VVSTVELQAHSYYSFLEGASSPEALAQRAAELGMPALALTDRNGLYGASLFARACKEVGIRPIFGAQLDLADDCILLLCKDMRGYRNLSQLITAAQAETPKGTACATLAQLDAFKEGLICLIGGEKIERYRSLYGLKDLYVALTSHCEEGDLGRCRKLRALAQAHGLRSVAVGASRYATQEEGKIYDVLICIKHRTTLRESHHLRAGNHERFLKTPISPWPDALQQAAQIAEECSVDLDFSSYRFPDFPLPEGLSAHGYLRQLCLERLPRPSLREKLLEELQLIEKLGLSGYFLIVWDLVAFARRRGIWAQGRGSAANSIVAYVLGITPVDPVEHNLFLGRFIHEKMTAIPDIDLDFAASRESGRPDREEVIQYVYERYGKDHVAMVSTFSTFRHRSAVREIGKVLELPQEIIDPLAKVGFGPFEVFLQTHKGKQLQELVEAIQDVPRHLSIHVGGMLIASRPICEMVPLEPARMEGRLVCQWDKDMVDDAGLIKVDILSLGMLGVLGDAAGMIGDCLEGLTYDDPDVYKMISKANTIGVFQVESRAQMQSLPRTKPQNLPELAIQVAIIRPGPLQGNMVAPYIRRKQGREKVSYTHPCLEPVLQETLGVILFQEQVLKVAVAMAGFSSSQAEALRRAMSRKRSQQAMEQLREEFLEGAKGRGIGEAAAAETFALLEGFALYGFCKSHALSFATIAYRSAWLRLYHPAAFVAALLNNQPMGFYSPQVILQDAKRQGVKILPVDINASAYRCTLEGGAVRLGLLMIKGVTGAPLIAESRPYATLDRLLEVADERSVEALIRAGALDTLDSWKQGRRGLLWELWAYRRRRPLLPTVIPSLPTQSEWEKLLSDYSVMGLSAMAHPFQYLRRSLNRLGVTDSRKLHAAPDQMRLSLAGMVVCRQRPPTAKGFMFLTLEDEFGLMNIIIAPDVYDRYQIPIRMAPLLIISGRKQFQDGITNLISENITSINLS
jgi:error-prone DNA polymerase